VLRLAQLKFLKRFVRKDSIFSLKVESRKSKEKCRESTDKFFSIRAFVAFFIEAFPAFRYIFCCLLRQAQDTAKGCRYNRG
jgi:hypothetical protein